VRRVLIKLWAFFYRDVLSDVSYRFSFLLSVGGMLFLVTGLSFFSRIVNPATPGLDGMEPFPWMLIGLGFQFYFSTALYSFAEKVRGEQMMGTLEAMLVSPTPTSLVIFSSTAYDFTWGAFRLIVYLSAAVFVYGVKLHVVSPLALFLGIALTLLSSAGIGLISASFILYFKRGDPVNLFLSGGTFFFGNVFIPSKVLPPAAQWISAWFPMAWSMKVVRGALLQGASLQDVAGELGRLAVLTLVLVPLGLWGSRIAIRRAKREGTLIQY
jgi:ABC-2 type transport system permease protein